MGKLGVNMRNDKMLRWVRLFFELLGYCVPLALLIIPTFFSPVPVERVNASGVYEFMADALKNGRESELVVLNDFSVVILDKVAWAVSDNSDVMVVLFVVMSSNGSVECYGAPRRYVPFFCGEPKSVRGHLGL